MKTFKNAATFLTRIHEDIKEGKRTCILDVTKPKVEKYVVGNRHIFRFLALRQSKKVKPR